MATVRNLKIKTSTCKRIVKELHPYEKEVKSEAAKPADMKDKGADPCDLKQQMPMRSRVRSAGRVRTRRIADVSQPSRVPLVDEEVHSYVGEPFEGNSIYNKMGASNALVRGDSTRAHYPPSGSIPPAPTIPQGSIPVPPQHPPPPPPLAYQAYHSPLPGCYPPPFYYAPPLASAPLNVPSGAYAYPYYYPPAWGYGVAQVAPVVKEETIAKRAKENGAVEFDGKKDPIVAENFLDRVEKAFEFMRLTDEQKCYHVYPLLTEQADKWWRNVQGKFTVVNPLTWEKFKDEFRANYMSSSFMDEMKRKFYRLMQGSRTVDQYDTIFHELVQFELLTEKFKDEFKANYMSSFTDEMKRKFYRLTQGSRTVDQYDTLFHELVQFVPYLRDNEQGKMDHFLNGLNAELRSRMRLLTMNSLTEMTSYARKAEFAEKEWQIGQDYQRKKRNRERRPIG